MRIKLVFVSVALVILYSATAQDKKIKFNSINTGGIILGQDKPNGMFQSVNGLSFQKWFAGLGAGYDFYYLTSIPVFIDVRRYLDQKSKGFLYADIGYNFPGKNKPRDEVGFYTSYHFSGGVYSDIGIGYGFALERNIFLLFSGGFSYKNLRNRIGIAVPCINPPCPETVYNYTYDLNTLSLKAGIRFK